MINCNEETQTILSLIIEHNEISFDTFNNLCDGNNNGIRIIQYDFLIFNVIIITIINWIEIITLIHWIPEQEIRSQTIYELNIVPLTLLTQFYLIQFNSHVQIGKKIQKI